MQIKVKIHLSEMRRSKGISLRQLSELSGVSKSAIDLIETEQVSPTLDTLCKIAKALDVDVTSLFSYQ